jgi:tyrosinase
MIIRKNVKELSATEKANYVNGVKALKTSGTFDSYVQTHNNAMNHTTPNGSNAAHMGPAFLPWHREYILRLEKDIRTAIGDPNFGLPYWDWAADAALPNPKQGPVWATDFMGGEGNPVTTGPFRSGQWTLWPSGSLVRAFGQSVATLPTNADVTGALAVTPYDAAPWNMSSNPSFRNKLEGWINGPQLHNRVHVWVGGSMLPMTSPNDPVFFLHHCNVDRLWAAWQSKNPGLYLPTSGGPTGHNLNDQMWPWNTATDKRTPADLLDHVSLGYLYDTEKFFFIKSRMNGFVLDIFGGNPAQGTQIISWPQKNSGTDNQLWQFVPSATPNFFFIKSKLNGMVLDIFGANPGQGTNMIDWPQKSTGTDNQLWTITRDGFIQSKLNGMVIDIFGANPAQGTKIIDWPKKTSGTTNQQWWFVPA